MDISFFTMGELIRHTERQMKNTYAPVHSAAKLLGWSIAQGREGTVRWTQMLKARPRDGFPAEQNNHK